MTLTRHSRPALLLACLSLSCAIGRAAPDQDPVRAAEQARRDAETIHHTLTTMPSACTLGSAGEAAQRNWLPAPKATIEPDRPYTHIYLFDKTASATAFHAGLNREALDKLDKVEFRDGQGNWIDAGPVSAHAAPPGCDYVWLQQALGKVQQIDALRFSFHPSLNTITVSEPGVLQAGAGGQSCR